MAIKILRQTFAASCLAVFAAATSADVLYSQAPTLIGLNGIQADGSTGPYSQNFTVASGAMLESIEWFGYHGLDSAGPSVDLFTVQINGSEVVASSLTSYTLATFGNAVLYKYVLDIDDIAIVSGTLELANGVDTEWFWQCAQGTDCGVLPDDIDPAIYKTAFTLNGTVSAVPEPQTGALILLGLAAMAGISRRNRRA